MKTKNFDRHKTWQWERQNQLVVTVRDFSKGENLPPVQVKLLAKDKEEPLKLTHKIFVDRPHRNICVIMLRYNVEKAETS